MLNSEWVSTFEMQSLTRINHRGLFPAAFRSFGAALIGGAGGARMIGV